MYNNDFKATSCHLTVDVETNHMQALTGTGHFAVLLSRQKDAASKPLEPKPAVSTMSEPLCLETGYTCSLLLYQNRYF